MPRKHASAKPAAPKSQKPKPEPNVCENTDGRVHRELLRTYFSAVTGQMSKAIKPGTRAVSLAAFHAAIIAGLGVTCKRCTATTIPNWVEPLTFELLLGTSVEALAQGLKYLASVDNAERERWRIRAVVNSTMTHVEVTDAAKRYEAGEA